MLKDQKKQLEYLQKSLKKGRITSQSDKFGYQATFRDYISQAGSLKASTSQQNETIASQQNAAASQTQAEIGNLISQTEAKISDYQTAKSAIEQALP